MSPVDEHLQVSEIRDFAPGLWEAPYPGPATQPQSAGVGAPPSAAGRMIDCTVAPSSKLIVAPIEPNTVVFSTSFPVVGLHMTSGIVTGGMLYRVGYDAAGLRQRLYAYDGTNTAEVASIIIGSAQAQPPSFVSYMNSAGTYKTAVAFYSGSADDGVWLHGTSYSTVATKIASDVVGPLAVHQGRIFGVDKTRRNRLRWTDVGGETFPAINYLDLSPSDDSSSIRLLATYEPSDLVVGRDYSAWQLVQGDISAPVVRSMTYPGYLDFQKPAISPDGIYYALAGQGLWKTTNGGDHVPVSPQLNNHGLWGTFWTGLLRTPGDFVYANGFVFCPDGYVYNARSNSWFVSSDAGLTSKIKTLDHQRAAASYVDFKSLLAANKTSPYAVYRYQVDTGTGGAQGFTYKTGPLFSGNGRQIRIRQVLVEYEAYAWTGGTLAVTVGGATRTHTIPNLATSTTLRRTARFLFNEVDRDLAVTVVLATGSALTNAVISNIRIGWLSGHYLGD